MTCNSRIATRRRERPCRETIGPTERIRPILGAIPRGACGSNMEADRTPPVRGWWREKEILGLLVVVFFAHFFWWTASSPGRRSRGALPSPRTCSTRATGWCQVFGASRCSSAATAKLVARHFDVRLRAGRSLGGASAGSAGGTSHLRGTVRLLPAIHGPPRPLGAGVAFATMAKVMELGRLAESKRCSRSLSAQLAPAVALGLHARLTGPLVLWTTTYFSSASACWPKERKGRSTCRHRRFVLALARSVATFIRDGSFPRAGDSRWSSARRHSLRPCHGFRRGQAHRDGRNRRRHFFATTMRSPARSPRGVSVRDILLHAAVVAVAGGVCVARLSLCPGTAQPMVRYCLLAMLISFPTCWIVPTANARSGCRCTLRGRVAIGLVLQRGWDAARAGRPCNALVAARHGRCPVDDHRGHLLRGGKNAGHRLGRGVHAGSMVRILLFATDQRCAWAARSCGNGTPRRLRHCSSRESLFLPSAGSLLLPSLRRQEHRHRGATGRVER